MARRKKRRKKDSTPKARTQRPVRFNPAFEGLKGLSLASTPPEKVGEDAAPPQETPPGDEQIFLDAVSDVVPIRDPRGRAAPTPNPHLRPGHRAPDDELETLSRLQDLVDGVTQMDITFSDEYVEGCVPGFSPRLMKRLKRGEFPLQAHVDLHGLTKREAAVRVREFLVRSNRHGMRCVLVVHGRGLNSENHMPVLKDRLPVWLSRGPAGKIVLAFCTARPYDGGTGALYVLLRKRIGGAL
ncbi:MAG: Smr/MutS family protein [Deltaproteobacteria bacterium]|nr:Smr/MutS family protein [Deltaproteobacteria bacterium]